MSIHTFRRLKDLAESHSLLRLVTEAPSKGMGKGYKDVVIHVSLLQVLHDGALCDLGQQHHVVHAAVLHIVAVPVVPVGTFASLWTKPHTC